MKGDLENVLGGINGLTKDVKKNTAEIHENDKDIQALEVKTLDELYRSSANIVVLMYKGFEF